MTVVVGFVICRGGVASPGGDPTVEAPIVEPVDPFQGGVFDVVESLPLSSTVDQFGLVEAVDRFRHRIVVTVPD